MNSNFSSSMPTDNENQPSAAFNYQSWREKFIVTLLRIACVGGLALIVFSFPTATSNDRILFISLYIILLAATILPLPYTARAYILLGMSFAIGVNSLLAWGPWLDGSIFFILLVILAALLFDVRIDIFALIISILTFVFIGALQQLGSIQFLDPDVPVTIPFDWLTYLIDFSMVSIVMMTAIAQFKREFARTNQQIESAYNTLFAEREQLEIRVQERTAELESRTTQLRSSTTLARTVAEIRDIEALMETVARLVSEKFEYYHVGLYLLDQRKNTIFLQAASSVTGKQFIGQSFHIEPDRRNPINIVVEQNRAYIASDISASNFVRDPNFPLTRSRMILPLTVRGEVIGALDMHSDQQQTSLTQDAEILQTLADLVAISIDNTRLINETKALVNQLEENTAIQTKNTWTKFTRRHTPAYQYTPAGIRPIFSPNNQEHADGLSIPLVLHGQKIGTIKLKRKGYSSEWSERERTLVEKIADQVALALDNSRLVDETQKNALRDQMIANISSRVRETLDVESVIRTAATELRRVFDLKEAEISVGSPQSESAPVRKHTSSLRLK